MSVSLSVSPLLDYPGGFGYASGTYGQYQQHQFGQHTTPHGLPPITPSMPSFTFLPSALPSGLHMTPTGTSAKVGAGGGGQRRARSGSKSLARQLESELGSVGDGKDENDWINSNNANVPVSSRHSSSASSSPPLSPTQQRHPHHHHQHHHHQNQQYNKQPTQVKKTKTFLHSQFSPPLGQQSSHQNQPPRHTAAAGSGSNAQPTSDASNASTHPHAQMHINLTSIPGAFSPGVVMSPGTFYGRPGEVPTFINAAVGAPLTMKVDDGDASGDGGVASEVVGGPAGVAAPIQGQGQGQGQWYHQNQTHGAYFYAMSSPRRRTPTGMEPTGYFDPLYFPAGVSVGGYTSSMGGSALVNEIMKDGHAHALGVEVGPRTGGKDGGGTGKGEEETQVSDDGEDEEEDSGDDDVDGDADAEGEADDDGEGEDEEEENQEAQDSRPPDEDGDRRAVKATLFDESSISRSQSLPVPKAHHHHHHQHQHHQQHNTRTGVARVEEAHLES